MMVLENCAQLLEEEVNKMFGTKYLNDEHDCNVVTMNSLNSHDANDMQSQKLGDAMFDEDDIFSPPSFDDNIYYDESMPPIYDDYCHDTYAIKNKDNHETFHRDFNSQINYVNEVSHEIYFVEFAPLLLRINLLMWRVIKFLCLCIMKRMIYVMALLLNSFMMLLKIIMREDHMLLHIAIITSFLSMC